LTATRQGILVEPVNLFALASKQAEWLSVRQAAVAGNVANANTPGYKAVDAEPFAKVLERQGGVVRATHVNHIVSGAAGGQVKLDENDPGPVLLPSGNTVKLEDELIKAGEVRRSMELNTAIVKAFHRMIMMNTRG
jgi:flagellar basal-body rod protein FlgB